jgi:hypothetical protein
MRGQLYAAVTLPPVKQHTQYQLNRSAGGPQIWYERGGEEKLSPCSYRESNAGLPVITTDSASPKL